MPFGKNKGLAPRAKKKAKIEALEEVLEYYPEVSRSLHALVEQRLGEDRKKERQAELQQRCMEQASSKEELQGKLQGLQAEMLEVQLEGLPQKWLFDKVLALQVCCCLSFLSLLLLSFMLLLLSLLFVLVHILTHTQVT